MISMFFLLIIGVVALILILVLGALGTKMSHGSDSDVIKKVYVYLVLFATLMMTIGGGVSLFMNIADMIAPTNYSQSFEEYKMYSVDKSTNAPQKSEDELRAAYDRMIIENNAQQAARAKNNMIKSLGWIIIPLPIFIYFQRKLNKND